MSFEEVPKNELVRESIYMDWQRQKQLEQFDLNADIVSRKDNNWDYFEKDFRKFAYPVQFPPLCPERKFEALIHYNQDTRNFGVSVGFEMADPAEVKQFLRKLNKMVAGYRLNRPISDADPNEEDELEEEEVIAEIEQYNTREV